MKLHLFIPLCLTILLLAFNSSCQNDSFGEMDIVTIVKQSGEVTSISIVAPKKFDGVTVKFSIQDTSGSAVFKGSGMKANTSFTINPLMRFLKGKSLYLDFDNQMPQLVIPMLYVDGLTNVIGRGEVITHTAKMSNMGIWSCRTSVIKETDIAKNLAAIPDELKGRGTVIIIPIENTKAGKTEPEIQDYYETFLPGESIIRKTGRLKQNSLKREFHGRAAQISHVMNQQGINAIMESNLKPGFYRWFAADLSDLYVWAPADNIPENNASTEVLLSYISNEMIRYDSIYNSGLSVYPVAIYSSGNTDALMKYWRSVRYFINEKGETKPLHLPKMKVMNFESAVGEMIANIDIPISLMGEYHCVDNNVLNPEFLNNLKMANIASHKLLTTEKIATVLALLKGGFLSYPEEEIKMAWEYILDSNDPDNELNECIKICDSILFNSVKQITPLISTQGIGKPVVVINPGTHNVSDMIAFPTNIPAHDKSMQSPGKMRPTKSLNWRVFDVDGVEAPAQMMMRNNEQYLLFTANNISGTGLKTFYLKAADDKQTPFPNAEITSNNDIFEIENQYYKIHLSAIGISSIHDKKHNAELIKQGSSIGSVIIRNKKNNEQIFQSDPGNALWSMNANGPVMTEFTKIDETPIGKIVTTLTLFHQVKKIAFDMILAECDKMEDIIVYTPLIANMTTPTIYYKVPLGFSKLGYSSVEEDIFLTPKEKRFSNVKNVNGIATINNGDIEIALSGDFLLCDIVNVDEKYMNVSLMNVIGKNSKSLFHFQISSSYAGDKQLRIDSYIHNKPLIAIGAPEKNMGMIPDQLSFFDLRNRELEILSLRKAPGGKDVVLRILETQGKKGFAIMEPMFSFSGFSTCTMNMENPELIPSKQAARLKLKTSINPWATSTILMHR